MKYIDIDELDRLPGKRLHKAETFSFDCYPGIACFNQCCRNLNLFLYPYDVIRLKNSLGISSDLFLDRYVDVVLRPNTFFPEVLLKMSDDDEKSCSFQTTAGCEVYSDRPDTCRKFPMEQGFLYEPAAQKAKRVYFFKPPEFCLGPREDNAWTPTKWNQVPDNALHDRMTVKWAELKGLFQGDPWGKEGPEGPKAKMAFMATYNIDSFREFVFGSSFLKRYKVKNTVLKKIRNDDSELLILAFDWVKFYLWKIKSKKFRLRH